MTRTLLASLLLATLLSVVGLNVPTAAQTAAGAQQTTLWVTADTLMPEWGIYPNSQTYGDTRPLGQFAAWTASGNRARLTWVAEVPAAGAYQLWVRRYGGYGNVNVQLDELGVAGGRGGPGGGRYIWRHLGAAKLASGRHHVDLLVDHCMFDAVLLTTDPALDPARGPLPKPESRPVLRALRTYRDDAGLREASGRRGFVAGQVSVEEELLYDWLPQAGQLTERLRLWGAANQYVNGTLAVRALDAIEELRVSLPEMVGPGARRLGPQEIDLRVVYVWPRQTHLFQQSSRMLVPELLLRDDRTALPPKGRQGGFGGGQATAAIPAHQSRQLWLTVHVPAGSPPGLYRGQLALEVAGAADRQLRLPVELEVLAVDLRPAEGYYSIYWPSQPVDPQRANYVSRERYAAELADQARHGLNAVTLYGGFATLDLVREAGMFKPPCVMGWPGGDAARQVEEARRLGFEDLYYYGVDEPNSPAQIERCQKEAERRKRAGLHMMTAINGRQAQEATKDFVDRPVYNLYVFGGPDAPAAMYARQKGFRPISYWTTATHWPLWFRAMTGLYNKRCGYLGSAPWAYQDFPDNRLYDPDRAVHRVAYPDSSGQPIPTLAWEAHRAGIDDVRYLEALDRAMAAAEKRLAEPNPPAALRDALARARTVRQRHFEAITGRWFQYVCTLEPGCLERTRRDLAEATIPLQTR